MFVLRKKCIRNTEENVYFREKNETNESTTKLYNLKINIPEENHIWIYVGYGTMIHLPKKRKGNGRYGTWLYHIWLKHTHKHRESEVPFFGHIVGTRTDFKRKCIPSFNNIIIIVHIVDVLISIRLSPHHHRPSFPLHPPHHHQTNINKTYLY